MDEVPFIVWSSEGLAAPRAEYPQWSVVRFRDRARPTLMRHERGAGYSAAYFKDDAEARTFCEALGLRITDHRPPMATGAVCGPESANLPSIRGSEQ